jgi:MarR family transcriptional regulator, transcriptional regulator for hemolysin
MDRFRNFGFCLKDVSRLYSKRFEERAAGLSFTLAQCKALAILAKNAGISQKRLSELADIEPMTLVRILDRMEADGWIERRADPSDRRARSLYATDKANPILDQIWQVGLQTRNEALAGLGTEERNTLFNLLERVHENLLSLKPVAESPNPAAARNVAPPLKPAASLNRKTLVPK